MGSKHCKPGFEKKTVSQILHLQRRHTTQKNNIDARIDDLHQDEYLGIGIRLIPGMYIKGHLTEEESALAWQKYGPHNMLKQPRSEEEALRWNGNPLMLRREMLKKMQTVYKRAEENPSIGIGWLGITEDDRRKRVFQWNTITEARALVNYCDRIGRGIIDKIYEGRDAHRIGAQVHASVPSRREGYADYKVILEHVPVDNGTDKRAIVWNLDIKPSGNMPANARNLVRRKSGTENTIDFFEQSIAAYQDFARQELSQGNFTPTEMSMFPALDNSYDSFASKLDNNVVVYNFSNQGWRHLYEAEKSWILMQRIQRKGPESMN